MCTCMSAVHGCTMGSDVMIPSLLYKFMINTKKKKLCLYNVIIIKNYMYDNVLKEVQNRQIMFTE